jgi:hypothetical protein
MKIDDNNLWIDEPLDVALCDVLEVDPLPPDVPGDWLTMAGDGSPRPSGPPDVLAEPDDAPHDMAEKETR